MISDLDSRANAKSLNYTTVTYNALLLTLSFLSALNLKAPAFGNFNVALPFASVNAPAMLAPWIGIFSKRSVTVTM